MIPQVFCLEIVELQVEAMATLHSSDDTSMSASTAEVFLFSYLKSSVVIVGRHGMVEHILL